MQQGVCLTFSRLPKHQQLPHAVLSSTTSPDLPLETHLRPEACLTEQHTRHKGTQGVAQAHLLGQQAAATHSQQAGSNKRLTAAAVGHHLQQEGHDNTQQASRKQSAKSINKSCTHCVTPAHRWLCSRYHCQG